MQEAVCGDSRPAGPDRSGIFAGVELGGTKCICTLATGPEHILDQKRIDTSDPARTLEAIEQVLVGWLADHDPVALGIASFGPLDLDPMSSTFGDITATTKPGWRNTDVARRLQHITGLPMAIDTDVAGAALAEGLWGAAQGLSSYAYITIGTGVGAGLVVNGMPVRGLGHPEAGHMHVQRAPGDDWRGACPFHGDCVEGLASGYAIAARTGRPAGELAADDPAWALVAHSIAGLCHSLIATVVPQRILIGGGVISGQPQLIPMIRRSLLQGLGRYGDAQAVTSQIERFVTVPALGELAGPLGAIALAADSKSLKPVSLQYRQ